MKTNQKSTQFFTPSFLTGMGSVLDIFPSYTIQSQNPKDDQEEILSDWKAVGNDIRSSIEQVISEPHSLTTKSRNDEKTK